MAEEVDVSSKDNPFSFRNFLSQRGKGGDEKVKTASCVKEKQPQDDDTNNVLFPEVTGEERGEGWKESREKEMKDICKIVWNKWIGTTKGWEMNEIWVM